ncbi:MAG: TetR/AcrR family transcriptional regulator [Nocardioides sp.]
MTTTGKTRGRPPSSGRDEILRATHDLLRERGIARLTTREVAERARVSEGSIFYHFTDRPGLLKAVFERSLGPLHFEPPSDDADDDLRTTLGRISARIESFLTDSLDVLMAAQADSELRDALHGYMLDNDFGPHRGIAQIGQLIAARQAAGRVRDDVDPTVVAAMIVNDAFQRASLPKLVGHRKGIPSRKAYLDTLVVMLAPSTP